MWQKIKSGSKWVGRQISKHPYLVVASTTVMAAVAYFILLIVGVSALAIGISVVTCATVGPFLGGLLGWVSRKLRSRVSQQPEVERSQEHTEQKAVDFSFYMIGGKRYHTTSYAKIYEMSAKRKWQWLRNLIFLKKWQQIKQENEEKILSQFSNEEKSLANSDLSFEKNPIPLNAGDAYFNQEAFQEYLGYLANHRHYHLFSHVLICILKKNSVSTIDLLKNLIHARDQLIENHFFEEDFTLLYVKNKSQQWIASLMYRIVPKKPTKTIGAIDWYLLDELNLEKNILLCDDICYTGTQVRQMLSSLGTHYKNINITLLFGQMSIYALSVVNETIKNIKASNRNFDANIVVGKLFHTVSTQLDFFPFPPTQNERHILKQILYSDFSEHYSKGDLRRIPLVTTAWKKPDFVSSYFKFLGYEKNGPNTFSVSSALLSEPPSEPITLLSNFPRHVEVSKAFIGGPDKPPYKKR